MKNINLKNLRLTFKVEVTNFLNKEALVDLKCSCRFCCFFLHKNTSMKQLK
jgi:hypothetical protein